MFANVTSQIFESIDWWSNISLTIQLLGSFLIAFFTIRYSQYLQDKKEFEGAMIWLTTEGIYLQNLLTPVSILIDEKIKEIDDHPNEKRIELFFFPDIKLNSLNFIMSKGYFRLFTQDYVENLFGIITYVNQLNYNYNSYNQINSMASQITIENYNKQKLDTFKTMRANIDSYNRHWNAHKISKYPKTFQQYFWP